MTDRTPVVLSYGLGADSTAILLRWLLDPSSRDFDLDDLIVLTAMTGDEFVDTGRMVSQHLLPLLAAAGVRYVQIARGGERQADGVVVLDDSRSPTEVHLAGAYKLSEEMRSGGTVPQVASGRRLCSIKQKGWPLDTWLAGELGTRPFRHVLGFNADEQRRADRDTSYSEAHRSSEYPLITWGWGREFLEQWLLDLVGEPWPKSCCTYCPFARDNHLPRYAEAPAEAVTGLMMEHLSLALNPRMTLFKAKSVLQLVEDHVPEAFDLFLHEVATAEHALYDVRRVFFAKRGDPTSKGSSARSVRTLLTGSVPACSNLLRNRAVEVGAEPPVVEDGVLRAWVNRQRPGLYPAIERFLVVAPAGAVDKERASFPKWWAEHAHLRDRCGSAVPA